MTSHLARMPFFQFNWKTIAGHLERYRSSIWLEVKEVLMLWTPIVKQGIPGTFRQFLMCVGLMVLRLTNRYWLWRNASEPLTRKSVTPHSVVASSPSFSATPSSETARLWWLAIFLRATLAQSIPLILFGMQIVLRNWIAGIPTVDWVRGRWRIRSSCLLDKAAVRP